MIFSFFFPPRRVVSRDRQTTREKESKMHSKSVTILICFGVIITFALVSMVGSEPQPDNAATTKNEGE